MHDTLNRGAVALKSFVGTTIAYIVFILWTS
jgi:hypothetical protein